MAKLLKRFLLILGAVGIIAANLETSANATKSGTAYNVGTVSMAHDRTLIFDLNVGIWKNGPTTVAVELIYPTNSLSYKTMKKLAGEIQIGQFKPLPPWSDCVGILTMAKNRTVTFFRRTVTNDVGDAIVESIFPPGNVVGDEYIKHVGGLEPDETKPVPLWPQSIGTATMSADGTIKLYLSSKTRNGLIADAVSTYKPGDSMYEEVKRHLGGINVGERKPVPPWLSDEHYRTR